MSKRILLLKSQLLLNNTNNSKDRFSHVPKAPLDAILGLSTLFKSDKDPNKVDLGIGAYRTSDGKPYVFNVVKEAEVMIFSETMTGKNYKEYQSSEGNQDFLDLSKKVVFGDLTTKLKSRISSAQAVGGTGALRIAADFLKKFSPSKIHIPNPTWGNHQAIFNSAGLEYAEYPYYNSKTRGLDIEGILKYFNNIPDNSIVLLHACAHNPTGVDPTEDEWKKIAEVMWSKNHYPFFDNAYQGFASGDLDKDAFAIRYFAEKGFEMIVTQSYSKTLGLYGERAGCFHILTGTEKTSESVLTQLRIVIRVNYSNPPLHSMKVVLKVLSDQNLYKQWLSELKIVAGRIIEMRKLLRQELEKINTPGNWENITNQIGMFSYTGLTKKQSERMVNQYHIYMLGNGRISMSGVNSSNVKYIEESMKKSIEQGE
jgi:aspartate/tyrosine/aromatic aminotransferase